MPELLGHPPRVVDVGDRAASGIRGPAPELQGHADHVVAVLLPDAAAATDESTPPDIATITRTGDKRTASGTFGSPAAAAAARPTTQPLDDLGAWRRGRCRHRASVELGPSENRTALSPGPGVSPMAISTWLGSRAPLAHAAPAEAQIRPRRAGRAAPLDRHRHLEVTELATLDVTAFAVSVTPVLAPPRPSASRSRSADTRCTSTGRVAMAALSAAASRRCRPRRAFRVGGHVLASHRAARGPARALRTTEGAHSLRPTELVRTHRHEIRRLRP